MALPTPSPDHTALVTGASSGIGAEIARQLAAKGHGVTLVARREAKLRELAGELHDKHGVRTEVIAADLTDEAARAGIATEVVTRGLDVSILVNNAGFTTWGAVHKAPADHDLALVRTNVEAVVHLCNSFLPAMVERRSGAVLNVASTVAFQPMPGQASYGASKAFVLSYSQALQGELRGTGVAVTILCPGPVETGFIEAGGLTSDEAHGATPKSAWVSAADVAKAAVEGMEKGRGMVIPGAVNRASSVLGALTPRSLLVPILAKVHPALKR